MENKPTNNQTTELLKGLDAFISSKTIVGEPITVGETIIIPLMDLSLGVGTGSFKGKSDGNAGGMGATMKPSSIIVMNGDNVRLVRIQNDDTLVKVLDMLPELVGRVKDKLSKKDPKVEKKIREMKEEVNASEETKEAKAEPSDFEE